MINGCETELAGLAIVGLLTIAWLLFITRGEDNDDDPFSEC